MTKNQSKYLKDVYENNFEIGEGDKKVDEESYEVDKVYDSSGIVFLSEWFFDEQVHEYTGINEEFFQKRLLIPTQYNFPDSYQKLNNSIKNFHIKEGFRCNNSEIFITEGSTPMIASMVIFAKKLGFKEIISIPPLYFNIFKVAELVDIPISKIHEDIEISPSKLSLPTKKSILFITDPIWSLGMHHPEEVFTQIRKWQDNTGSLVFVDGSFSYTDWYKSEKKEQSAQLNPELTFRLVCPTKALALNGLRFSYLICPEEFKKELSRITCSTIGSSSYYSFIFREKMFKKMIKPVINPVGKFSRDRFDQLRPLLSKNNINYIKPDCGFFMFVELKPYLESKDLLDSYMWIPNKGLDIFNKELLSYTKLNLIMRDKSFMKLCEDLQ